MTKPKMFVILPPPDCCQVCAKRHEPDQPHDRYSIYYIVTFRLERGYEPSWQDAMEHCSLDTQIRWERELRERGHWAIEDLISKARAEHEAEDRASGLRPDQHGDMT